MMNTQNVQMIKDSEALRLTAYLPTPNDRWTIGWGHTSNVSEGMTITEAQAEAFLRDDLAWAENAVNSKVTVGLTQHHFDALVSFVFNIGAGAFASSTLLRKLNAGDYEGAANEFPRWNKQAGKVLGGLVTRRAAEMEYFLRPDMADEEPLVSKPDEVAPLKPMITSKELIAASGAFLTGGAGVVGALGAVPQIILSAGLTIALLAFGAFIMWNRVQARKRGER